MKRISIAFAAVVLAGCAGIEVSEVDPLAGGENATLRFVTNGTFHAEIHFTAFDGESLLIDGVGKDSVDAIEPGPHTVSVSILKQVKTLTQQQEYGFSADLDVLGMANRYDYLLEGEWGFLGLGLGSTFTLTLYELVPAGGLNRETRRVAVEAWRFQMIRKGFISSVQDSEYEVTKIRG